MWVGMGFDWLKPLKKPFRVLIEVFRLGFPLLRPKQRGLGAPRPSVGVGSA